ncbi:hypothetical protein TVAG_027090 [Trichomonas vaginalis G3]|uniref:Uncharacterized protein n=1 Tax=Trichomonas vaginalis (strain ATCC PRA-98 / G3) TaxID=412133 RepID=A2F1F4_TRIV3|nr:hypothetical protein TVAGG3_0947670 [Trichomonas vaginalis G3]EAY01241.1 hypothetical protein TVAG_027090 [Trichomonas vaginalis G3]KAI5486982.1 hypothetical protein TVAGG3_0947670 [Trichomonas vaginalis G3]|eukprot:XP_001314056.1 hypothetical protein [Trichomonas vaginalis G3]
MEDNYQIVRENLDRDESKTEDLSNSIASTSQQLDDLQTSINGMTITEIASNILHIIDQIHNISDNFNEISNQTNELIASHLETEEQFEKLLEKEKAMQDMIDKI